MTNPEARDPAAMVVLASQIITGALIAGPIPLLIVAFFIGPLLGQPPGAVPPAGAGQVPDGSFQTILSYAAIGAGAVAILLSSIAPRLISTSATKSVAPTTPASRPGKSAGKAKRPGLNRPTSCVPSCFRSFKRSSSSAQPSSRARPSSERLHTS